MIHEKDLIPEGITYSSNTKSFYLGSLFKTKIIQIDSKTGAYKDFIPSDLIKMRFTGMIVDDHNNDLWTCGNMRENETVHSAVFRFNLLSNEIKKVYSCPDSLPHLLNDLVLDDFGNVYFTDSNGQRIYKIDIKTDKVNVFFESNEIEYPNGITISPDNTKLYIASYYNGLKILDIKERKIINSINKTINSSNLDGIKYYKNSIIGIQNYINANEKCNITRFYLNKDRTQIINAKVMDKNNPNFDYPTTFVIVNKALYCIANSQLGNVNFTENNIPNPEKLTAIKILKYKLHW